MGPTFARRVFLVAAIYGIAVLAPQYLVELGLPALMERPEHYYGFIGVALAWQFVFLIVASDVMRYRPLMLAGVLEKVSFGAAVAVLYLVNRVSIGVLLAGTLDLILGALFVAAFIGTRPCAHASDAGIPGDRVRGERDYTSYGGTHAATSIN